MVLGPATLKKNVHLKAEMVLAPIGGHHVQPKVKIRTKMLHGLPVHAL